MPVAAGVTLSLADIAAQLGGDVLGDADTLIRQVATLASAGEGEIVWLHYLIPELHFSRVSIRQRIAPPNYRQVSALARMSVSASVWCWVRELSFKQVVFWAMVSGLVTGVCFIPMSLSMRAAKLAVTAFSIRAP